MVQYRLPVCCQGVTYLSPLWSLPIYSSMPRRNNFENLSCNCLWYHLSQKTLYLDRRWCLFYMDQGELLLYWNYIFLSKHFLPTIVWMFFPLSEPLAKAYCSETLQQHSPMTLKLSMTTAFHNKLFVLGSSQNQHEQLQINVAAMFWLTC